MEKIEVKLEKDNNDFFREWIIKEWQHHNTVDPIYQLRIIKPEELKFKENEEYYKILYNNKMVGFIGIKNYEKEIYLYINSPGGSITDGMGIVDTMNYISCPVSTICVGMAASMGAVLLASGEKGKRFATPNSEILIHQPLIGGGGLSGQTTEIKIHADHMVKTREKLNKLLSDRTGQSLETIQRDTERDNYMTAEEALKYGLIDGIMDKRK